LLASCAKKKDSHVRVPPAPPITKPQTKPESQKPSAGKNPEPAKPQPPTNEPNQQPALNGVEQPAQQEAIPVPETAKPVYVETGRASWYGMPYHNRRASNGKFYNMNAMTAAHRTLPMGSICRVTNLSTGHSALVRITDRGPFVKGRILDLSLAAAKAVDVWLPGIATVKMEVLQTPASLESGGHWALQIGAFEQERSATELAQHISRRYHTAKALSFSSPMGNWWVSVRVRDDDRQRAEELARETHTPEGSIFIVRLD
jgi:rare lipoprotein A